MMPEILTESFCERCGTRYTFESAAPRKTRRLGQIKTLSKGMKNWVMSDDTSLDEAMAAARNDDDRELTSHQLDAFHATFNFCMTCRQYTCGNCWNTSEGRCLTCAPHLGHEILPAPFPDESAFEPVRIEAEAWPEVDLSVAAASNGTANGAGNGAGNGLHSDALDSWASAGATELEGIPEFDPAARLAFLSGETPTPVVEPEPTEPAAGSGWTFADGSTVSDVPSWAAKPTAATPQVAPDEAPAPAALNIESTRPEGTDAQDAVEALTVEGEPTIAQQMAEGPAPVVEPVPPTVEARADAGSARTTDLLRRFRPGQNIDAELAAYEAELDRAAATAEPVAAASEPVVEVEPVVEPVAAAAAEPPTAAEPVLASAESEPVAAAPAQPAGAPKLGWPKPAPAAAPLAEPEPEPAPAPIAADAPRTDRIEQPTWQIFAPDATPTVGQPAQPPAPPAAPFQPPAARVDPQWPVQPDLADSPAMALLANRGNRSSSDALWAASAQEVLARPVSAPAAGPASGVQPCSSCGLSLSATARFCRRCGTRQG